MCVCIYTYIWIHMCGFTYDIFKIHIYMNSYICIYVNLFIYLFFNFFIFLILKSLILTCVPKHEPPSHLPPHNISLGYPQAPAPSMLHPASDIDWWFSSYMIVYMLECHSPKSSHPLPLPLSPKVHYTYLCLFCCLAYRVVIAIFLNSFYFLLFLFCLFVCFFCCPRVYFFFFKFFKF